MSDEVRWLISKKPQRVKRMHRPGCFCAYTAAEYVAFRGCSVQDVVAHLAREYGGQALEWHRGCRHCCRDLDDALGMKRARRLVAGTVYRVAP